MSKQMVVEAAAAAVAAFGDANDAVDAAVADVLGVNRTDLRLLGAVNEGGAVSAGVLAGAVGLSPAATTEAVQRLVARGLLVRTVDAADRRRAVITTTPACAHFVQQAYGPVGDAGVELLGRYTAAELAMLTDFLDRARALVRAQAERIRAEVAPPGREAG